MTSNKYPVASRQECHGSRHSELVETRWQGSSITIAVKRLLSMMTLVSWACSDSNSDKQAMATDSAYTSHGTIPYKKSKPWQRNSRALLN